MDPRNMMGDEVWNDPVFHTSQFEDMNSDSPFADFINPDHSYGDSPGLTLRAHSNNGREQLQPQQLGAGLPVGASTESSSQDSASDSSSRRKRKVTESPMSETTTETGMKQDETRSMAGDMKHVQQYPTRPMHELSLEQEQSMFDFNSAAGSPIQPRDFNNAMSLNAQMRMPTSTMAPQYQPSPVSAAGISCSFLA
jgi:uncharacterized protein